MKTIKAYKVFNPDWTCRGFQYEVGKSYTHEGNIELCQSGFHACINVADCFKYQQFNPKNKVALVQLSGEIIEGDDKCVSSKIKIIKEISWNDMLLLANTGNGNSGLSNSGYRNSGYRNSGERNSGYRNSGERNSGERNSGYRNSGYRNSGDRNSGYSNSGDMNSGDRNSGYRNSGDSNSGYRNSGVFCNKKRTDKILMFNKLSDWTWDDWINSKPYSFLNITLTEWKSYDTMSEEEKKNNPKSETNGGYLKVYGYKEAWSNLWNTLTEDRKKQVQELPNFDAEIFEFITGIKI